ncbi:MAG: hypothetical protein Rubg2KO_35530 [Rubricoccaceae bacterium]
MTRLWTLSSRLFVAFALLASTQGALWTHGAFQVRQDWIADHLCVNRHNPDVDCDGFCYLDKKMQEHQDHEDERGPSAVLTLVGAVAIEAPSTVIPPDRWSERETLNARNVRAPGSPHLDDVFRPPRAVPSA